MLMKIYFISPMGNAGLLNSALPNLDFDVDSEEIILAILKSVIVFYPQVGTIVKS